MSCRRSRRKPTLWRRDGRLFRRQLPEPVELPGAESRHGPIDARPRTEEKVGNLSRRATPGREQQDVQIEQQAVTGSVAIRGASQLVAPPEYQVSFAQA